MLNSLWELTEKSKDGKAYQSSKEQYKNLVGILANYDKPKRNELEEEWDKAKHNLTSSEEYSKLHWSNGGIIDSGDDGFYMDFGNWLVAQGKDLYDDFFTRGHIAVLDFIKKHNITKEDYMYECMIYAFYE